MLNKINRSDLHFYMHNVNYQHSSITGNQTISRINLRIPAKCQLLYLSILKDYQLYPFSQTNKNALNHYVWPRALEKITAQLLGQEVVGEWSNLGENTSNDESAQSYYQYLLDRKIVDASYESFYPVGPWGGKNFSFKQFLLIDLTQHRFNQSTTMEIVLKWKDVAHEDGDNDPHSYFNLFAMTVTDIDIVRDKKTGQYSLRHV